MTIMEVQHLNKIVRNGDTELQILSDINITINIAETIAIVGASGSGKSTLLGLLAGLDSASSGQVFFEQHDIMLMTEDERARWRSNNIGFVFQSFQLLPNLTALENVMLPLELKQHKDAKTSAQELLQQVGLFNRRHHYPLQLSGGEQQRVAIARAFASAPKILFADEPTGNLDRNSGANIIDLLFRLNSDNRTTLVLVTHDEKLAQRCKRQIVLNAGKIEAS